MFTTLFEWEFLVSTMLARDCIGVTLWQFNQIQIACSCSIYYTHILIINWLSVLSVLWCIYHSSSFEDNHSSQEQNSSPCFSLMSQVRHPPTTSNFNTNYFRISKQGEDTNMFLWNFQLSSTVNKTVKHGYIHRLTDLSTNITYVQLAWN